MHQTLLTLHSINRWLVLASLVYSIIISWNGYRTNRVFSGSDNAVRHLTATIAHIQLLLGLYLYMISPIVKFNVAEASSTGMIGEHLFFRLVHISLMVIAVVVITIGSASARRMDTDQLKYRTMLWWFSIALLIILVAIPWPFSPLVQRPFFRSF
ncbi:hypothetical protein [Dyadobacter sp. OTU695]|uniref:hypothetical protein n=1 Tax=Dyadobacter sp. OTU695 TaxID=3043860 RepID=UPI00313EC76C